MNEMGMWKKKKKFKRGVKSETDFTSKIFITCIIISSSSIKNGDMHSSKMNFYFKPF